MAVLSRLNYILFFNILFVVVKYPRFKVVSHLNKIFDGQNILETVRQLYITIVNNVLIVGFELRVWIHGLKTFK